MTFSATLERLRAAIDPNRVPHGKVTVQVHDLELLLNDHARADAQLRAASVREHPQAYPPRHQMLASVAADPGAYAGYKGDRTMGRWIADAILEVERHVSRHLILEVIERNWNAGPDALADAIMAMPDPGVEDFRPAAIAKRQWLERRR